MTIAIRAQGTNIHDIIPYPLITVTQCHSLQLGWAANLPSLLKNKQEAPAAPGFPWCEVVRSLFYHCKHESMNSESRPPFSSLTILSFGGLQMTLKKR